MQLLQHMMLAVILSSVDISLAAKSRQLDNVSDELSTEENFLTASMVLPKQIFNEGKPFYAQRDPISGQLDFNSKKPAGIEPEANEVIDQNEKNFVLNTVSPNFHDFLNLPTKYSSSKFVYPLVSSSYANLKYQGNNKNYISNHKNNTHSTIYPSYANTHKSNITRLHLAPAMTTQKVPITSSPKPISTEAPKFQYTPSWPAMKNDKKNIASSSAVPVSTTTPIASVTMKIGNPNRRPSVPPSVIPLPKSTTTKRTTTVRIPPPTLATSTTPRDTTTTEQSTTKVTSTTARPRPTVSITPTISTTPAFMHLPTKGYSTVDPSDVYSQVGQKKDPNTMTLSDLFNSLSDEEYSHYQSHEQNQGLTAQGDLMKPLLPSRPSPFSPKPTPFTGNKHSTPTQLSISTASYLSTTTTQRPHKFNEQPATSQQPNSQQLPDKYANEYVQYQVQQPNMNVLNYPHPVSSMNNILISPEQSSATFVLGSQQAVGNGQFVGSVDSSATVGNGHRIQYGTVINEDIASIANAQPSGAPLNRPQEQPISFHHQPNIVVNNQQESKDQELYVSSNIRFPSETEFANGQQRHPQGGVGSVITIGSTINGHSAPVALPHVQAQSVNFPNSINEAENSQAMSSSKVIFEETKTETHEKMSPKLQEVLTLNQQQLQNKIHFPKLAEDLTPPALEQQLPHINHPSAGPMPPMPPRQHQPSRHSYNEFSRKPALGPHRPHPDRPLPNILPQFRPNAKISSGHPASFNKEAGNIRLTHSNNGPNFGGNHPQKPPPAFQHRRYPFPNRYNNVKRPQESIEANRRVYKVPPQQGVPPLQAFDRMYLHHQGPQMINKAPAHRFVDPRNVDSESIYSLPEVEDVQQERLAAFEDHDFTMNDPPKAVMSLENQDPQKLEPVVTLQMLQSQKKTAPNQPVFNERLPENNFSPEIQQPLTQQITSGQPPVYVVYPVKSSIMNLDAMNSQNSAESVVVGQSPNPPTDVNSVGSGSGGAVYQNTPFSVVREQPQEPILMVKSKPIANSKANFPYPLEKPDAVFAEFTKQQNLQRYDHGTMEDLTARVVNREPIHSTHHSTEMPIAIAYTPTEPNPYYLAYHSDGGKYSVPNLASPVISEIRDTQTESNFHEVADFDKRVENYEKDFMAPFYPSMSLGPVTSTQQNGWAVLPPSTDRTIFHKNSINRADVKETQIHENTYELSTKKFEHDQFMPDLQGGFKPIYPSEYRNTPSSSEDDVQTEKEFSRLTSTTTAASIPSSSIASSHQELAVVTTTTTTMRPTLISKKPTKSRLEASIESLLFGNDEDFDNVEESKSRNSKS